MNFQIKEIENKIVNVHAEVAELGATLSRVTTIVDNNKVDIDASSDKLDRLGDDVDKLLTTHKRQP